MKIITDLINKLKTSTIQPMAATTEESKPKVYASELSQKICSLLQDPNAYERNGYCVIKFKNIDLYISPCDYGNKIELMQSKGTNFLMSMHLSSEEEKDIRPLANPIINGYIEKTKQIEAKKKLVEQQALLNNLDALDQQSKTNAAKAVIKDKMKTLTYNQA